MRVFANRAVPVAATGWPNDRLPMNHPANFPILLVDDDPDMLHLLSLRLGAAGYPVATVESAEQALVQMAARRPALVISDVQLPGRDGHALFHEIRTRFPMVPVILLTAHGTIPDAVDAVSRGVHGYLTKPFDGKLLLQKVADALLLSAPVADAAAASGSDAWRSAILSRSAAMEELLVEAQLVARSPATVLICGDSGSGKELLARAVHLASARAAGPFVALNCAAIPESLLESELFGHLKGAYTGATGQRIGLLQAASGGTLFLDEIGDMPLALQAKLLRALQERTVRPLGATQDLPVDLRVIAATHRDLEAAVRDGSFREDLYYRIAVVSLHLPPLSERREDIALLARHFLERHRAQHGSGPEGFAPDALKALALAAWPGNVRQLQNVVEQVCALCTTPLVPLSLVQRALRVPGIDVLSYVEAKERFERNYLVNLLRLTDGNVSDAARLAQRNRTEFYRLLQRHGLVALEFRSQAVSLPGDNGKP